MNPKLRRMIGSELFSQLQRIRVVAHTNRGELVVTEGEPRLFRVIWKSATVGFSDEPWDDPGKLRFSAIVSVEKLGGTFLEDGVNKKWPNWWICSAGLQGWYQQDVYIDGIQVLSKPQTDPWHNIGAPQTSYILWKLDEHSGPSKKPPRLIWNLKRRLRLFR